MEKKLKPIQSEPIKVRENDTPANILKEAKERAGMAYEGWKENFQVSREDVLFIAGNQWSAEELTERKAEGKISLTLNKLPQFVNRVVGAQRKNVQAIKVSSRSNVSGKEEKITTESGEELSKAQVLSDFIRNIEYESNAQGAYKMAFKHALEGGFGWLRVYTAYQEDGFDMDIKIKGIRNRYSVFIDPMAKEDDCSDMNYAFVTETMQREEFNKRYPGKSEGGLEITEKMTNTFWYGKDTVTIAEYFRREPYKKKISLLSNGEVVNDDDITEDIKAEWETMGIEVVKSRTVNTHKVIWSKITGTAILEEDREFPTTTIPIVPVLGREIDYDNERGFRGLIFDAKDAQKMFNATRSSAMERVNLVSKTPFVGTADAVKGYEGQWAAANTENRGILIHNKGTQAPQRQPMASAPVGELQLGGEINGDLQQSIGIYDASLGAKSNEISGKAIKARQGEADTGTFEFIDNLGTSIRRVGLLCVELVPKVYDTNRIIQIRKEDSTDDKVEINKPMDDGEGNTTVTNDLDGIKYNVVMETGASYATKREENADQILELMKINPKVSEVGGDILVKNLDFADSNTLAERLRKTLPANVLSKEEQEEIAKDAPKPQPSPEQIKAETDMKLKEMDMQMKESEFMADKEIEAIKLETARTNLKIKQMDLQGKAEEGQRKKDDIIVGGVIDQIKNSKKKEG